MLCRLAATTAVAIIAFGEVVEGVMAQEPPAEVVAAAAAERARYGLRADTATVSSIIRSGQDTGTAQWGIVLTRAEEAALDLPGRMEFVTRASEHVVSYARSLPTFAGAYVVPEEEGRVVILLTESNPRASVLADELTAESGRDVDVRLVTSTFDELKEAAQQVWNVWPTLSSAGLLEVAIDEIGNGLTVMLSAADDLTSSHAARDELSRRLGVPIALMTGSQQPDLVCSSRTNCHSPMRAGIRVDNDMSGGTHQCTMGFHILVNGDKQWLTAGHCGHGRPSDWWHVGYGQVGTIAATMYPGVARDIMRVKVNDTQVTNDIYGSGRQVTSARSPMTSETICASLGKTNAIDCGFVNNNWASWISPTCNCTMWGGDYDDIWPTQGGDSGSPMYGLGPNPNAVALGLLSNSTKFAHVQSALSYWSATVISQ